MAFTDYKAATAGLGFIFLALASAASAADVGGNEAAENTEARIEAIRNALLNRALQSEVRVRGMSWVDESGRLREHTLITSDLKVRGIRINAYVENDKPRESVVIDAVAAITSNKTCAAPDARLRRPALLEIDYQPKDAHSAQYQLAQVAKAVEKQVEAAFAGKGPWQLQKQSQLSDYAQLVNFGQRQSAPHRIRITVSQSGEAQHDGNAAAGIFRALAGLIGPPEAPRLALAISLIETATNRTVWNDSALLQLPAAPVSMQNRQPAQELQEAIARAVAEWDSKIGMLMKCEPVFFNLSALADGQHLINAGSAAGIRLHDKFVIVDQTRFPANVLGEELLQTVMLAEVESVSRSSAKIRIQGSRPANSGGRWVALPI